VEGSGCIICVFLTPLFPSLFWFLGSANEVVEVTPYSSYIVPKFQVNPLTLPSTFVQPISQFDHLCHSLRFSRSHLPYPGNDYPRHSKIPTPALPVSYQLSRGYRYSSDRVLNLLNPCTRRPRQLPGEPEPHPQTKTEV